MNVGASQVLGWLGVLQLVSERALGPWYEIGYRREKFRTLVRNN